MSYMDGGIRFLSRPAVPPPVGPIRWFANSIERQLKEGVITDDVRFIRSDDYDRVLQTAEEVAAAMAQRHFIVGKTIGYIFGSLTTAVIIFSALFFFTHF